MKKRLPEIKQRLADNGSYKLVALFVTLVLWVTILGRKDEVQVKEMQVEYLTSPTQAITNEVAQKIKVKVKGPRMALKKFTVMDEPVTLNISGEKPGTRKIEVTEDLIELPIGVKLISITPKVIRARIKEIPSGKDEG